MHSTSGRAGKHQHGSETHGKVPSPSTGSWVVHAPMKKKLEFTIPEPMRETNTNRVESVGKCRKRIKRKPFKTATSKKKTRSTKTGNGPVGQRPGSVPAATAQPAGAGTGQSRCSRDARRRRTRWMCRARFRCDRYCGRLCGIGLCNIFLRRRRIFHTRVIRTCMGTLQR